MIIHCISMTNERLETALLDDDVKRNDEKVLFYYYMLNERTLNHPNLGPIMQFRVNTTHKQ